MIDVEKFMTFVRISMLRNHCFYGHVLTQLPTVYTTTEVPTLGVGKSSADEIIVKLYVNTDYVKSIIEFTGGNEEKSVAHFVEVLKHEVHHLIFGHLSFNFPDKNRQTLAAEFSVNSYINRNKLISLDSDEPGVFPQDFGFEPKLSLKEYYDLLNSNEKYQKMVSAAVNEILSDLGEGEENQTVDSHKKWEALKDDPIAEEMVKDIIRQASETCKQSNNWGDISSDLVQAIQNCFEPKENIIPWQIILKNFLASSSENVLSYSMKRLSKRYGTRPGTKKEDVLSVAIGIDTSGSISNEMLTIFFAELESIAKTNTKMTVFEWDTKVQRKYDFRDFDGQVKGRGGTDANTALSEIAEENYDCIIMFTDFGFYTIKEEYGIPLLWVVDKPYSSETWSGMNMPILEGMVLEFDKNEKTFNMVNRND